VNPRVPGLCRKMNSGGGAWRGKCLLNLLLNLKSNYPLLPSKPGYPLTVGGEAVIHSTIAEGGDAFVEDKAQHLIQVAFEMLPMMEAYGPAQKQSLWARPVRSNPLPAPCFGASPVIFFSSLLHSKELGSITSPDEY